MLLASVLPEITRFEARVKLSKEKTDDYDNNKGLRLRYLGPNISNIKGDIFEMKITK